MRQEKNKKEIVVTLSERSVDDLANAIGGKILNNMEMFLKPIYEEIQNIKSEAESIERNTLPLLFSNNEDWNEEVE